MAYLRPAPAALRSPASAPAQHRPASSGRSSTRAEALLATETFRALTVEDLMARAAGLTRTAFYRYFPDLESVLLRRISELHAELAEAAAVFLAVDSSLDGALLAANTGLAEVYPQHGRMLLAFADAAGRGPEIEGAWHETIDSFVAPVWPGSRTWWRRAWRPPISPTSRRRPGPWCG